MLTKLRGSAFLPDPAHESREKSDISIKFQHQNGKDVNKWETEKKQGGRGCADEADCGIYICN